MQSNKYTLNQRDWEKWSLNFVIFCVIPSVTAFLTAIANGIPVQVAWGVALASLYGSSIDLIKKFIAGEAVSDSLPTQPNA